MPQQAFDWSQNYRGVDTTPLDLLGRITKRLNQRRRFFAVVSRLLPLPDTGAPPNVLEVACGMGIEASLLALLGYRVIGMDNNADSLEYARRVRKFLSARLDLQRGNAFKMGFGDAVFDLVYSQGFMEHWSDEDVVRLLVEQTRVLKTGGYLLFDVPNRYSAYTLYKLFFKLTGGWVFGFERQFSPGQIRKFARIACPSLVFCERYGWSFRGYPVRTPIDFTFMAPLLAIRLIASFWGSGHDNIAMVFRKIIL